MTKKSSKKTGRLNLLLVNGPLLGVLGKRSPEIYGTDTLKDIESWIIARAAESGADVKCFQSESEGDILKFLLDNADEVDGVIINPGAYAHYSIALRDCLEYLPCPVIEVHLTNLFQREQFRHESVTGAVCDGVIMGLGKHGYLAALMYLLNKLEES